MCDPRSFPADAAGDRRALRRGRQVWAPFERRLCRPNDSAVTSTLDWAWGEVRKGGRRGLSQDDTRGARALPALSSAGFADATDSWGMVWEGAVEALSGSVGEEVVEGLSGRAGEAVEGLSE